ncbi:hypothetical protein V6N13_025459 [Hibiscus sabdariffa]|uniref:Uncharacterized protein n=1 Tax=Hibiscus sabdariffa TaxID=183260 RepID=A0ABR2P8N1_9ROSI
MKIDGQTIKLKTPIRTWDALKDYPGHAWLDSDTAKHYGIRAKSLESHQDLKPKKVYFSVELPKLPIPDEKVSRMVRSGEIHMSVKDRLECLMLSRRTVSDLFMVKQTSNLGSDEVETVGSGE